MARTKKQVANKSAGSESDDPTPGVGPLDGIRVVEVATFVTGPFAGMMLADMGAEVIKVEPPTGEPFRTYGRNVDGLSINFVNANRNKKAVALDLQSDDGMRALRALLERADVLIANWRPGVAERLGLDTDEVRRQYPRLVWIRISGFGSDGPLASTPAFDGLIQARSGLTYAQGEEEPHAVWSWLADKSTATFAAQAAMAGLIRRANTGDGTIVELPMLDAFAYFNFPDLLSERTILDEKDRPPINPLMRTIRAVPTKDGWLMINPARGVQIKRAMELFGHGDRVAETKVLDPATAVDRFFRLAAEVTPTKTTAEWIDLLTARDVPAAPVMTYDEHLADPQVIHNRTYVEIDHPRFGAIRQPRFPARFSSGDAGIEPAPDLDQHRDEILASLTNATGSATTA
jgi:crotonobetainyl-CoA:carnitine CoA-transferase CaiB-like acyl-CoA transferase